MLKTKSLLLTLLAAFFVLTFAPQTAMAEQDIAIADIKKLLSESDAAKHIQTQVQKQRETFLQSVSKQEQDLKKTEKELIEKKATLSPEDFAKEKQEFEKKFIETRNEAQKQKVKLDKAAIKAVGELEEEIYKVIQGIADERELSLVLSKQSVVLGANSLDITAEAMKQLNKAISKIKLEL